MRRLTNHFFKPNFMSSSRSVWSSALFVGICFPQLQQWNGGQQIFLHAKSCSTFHFLKPIFMSLSRTVWSSLLLFVGICFHLTVTGRGQTMRTGSFCSNISFLGTFLWFFFGFFFFGIFLIRRGIQSSSVLLLHAIFFFGIGKKHVTWLGWKTSEFLHTTLYHVLYDGLVLYITTCYLLIYIYICLIYHYNLLLFYILYYVDFYLF